MMRVIAMIAAAALFVTATADGTFAQEPGKRSQPVPKNELEKLLDGVLSLPGAIIQIPICDEKKDVCQSRCASEKNKPACMADCMGSCLPNANRSR